MSMILYHSTLHCACRGPAEQNSDDPNVTIQIKSKLEKRMVILQSPALKFNQCWTFLERSLQDRNRIIGWSWVRLRGEI